MILLIYLSTNQIEKMVTPIDATKVANGKPPNGQTLSTHLSAGLTIKKYWSKFTHLCTTTRQLQCQVMYFKVIRVSSLK